MIEQELSALKKECAEIADELRRLLERHAALSQKIEQLVEQSKPEKETDILASVVCSDPQPTVPLPPLETFKPSDCDYFANEEGRRRGYCK